MRVLILLSSNSKEGFLVKLQTRQLIKELKSLLNKRKKVQAMKAVLTKGNIEKRIINCDISTIDADLILTKDATRWDLTAK
jgi:hypothetical protein